MRCELLCGMEGMGAGSDLDIFLGRSEGRAGRRERRAHDKKGDTLGFRTFSEKQFRDCCDVELLKSGESVSFQRH